MKKIYYLLPLLAVLLCCWSTPSFAQKDAKDNNKVIIIKKSIDENGVETIEKTIKEGDNVDVFRWNSSDKENAAFELEGEEHIMFRLDGEDGANTFSFEGNGVDMEKLKKEMAEMRMQLDKEQANVFLDFSKDNYFTSCDKKEQPFLGVVMKEIVENNNGEETIEGSTPQGVIIQEVVAGSAAEAAGLQEGDILTAIDGNATLRVAKVSEMILSKKVGEAINITYLRNGTSMQTSATLKARNTNMAGSQKKRYEFRDSDFNLDFDFDFDYDNSFERDPCKVFIGVYTSTRGSSDGVRVNGVIEDTPAFEAGILKGDIITMLDGAAVNTHQELLSERNKHEQGDEFTVTYIRNGEKYTVDAKFKSCPEEEVQEEVPATKEEDFKLNVAPGEFPSNQLEIDLTAFPNPTEGIVNIRFDGEKTATTVTVTDINGKEIYRDEINDFDGIYNKKVNLKGAALGPVIISVQQGSQVRAEKVMYVPSRA